MKQFCYQRPEEVKQVAQIAGNGHAKILAGGTDLLGTLKDNIHPEYVEKVVSLKSLPGLDEISEQKIGAMARLDQVVNDENMNKTFPVLTQAAATIASPQIRNMATVGGNICQEPRCWYYRYPDNKFFCQRKGGSYCPALAGNNKFHSIFGVARITDSPCQSACPNHTNIPFYLEKIREGDIEGAARILLEVNPIPAVTGRICPHYCIDDCNRGEYYEGSVAIRDIERFLGDYILDHVSELIHVPDQKTGKKVSVIGAGPAGLSAAFYLALAGHTVTVYDRNQKAGGMLRYAIPAYRLPRSIVDRVVAMLESMGITFVLGISGDTKLADYAASADAVFVGTGAWVNNKIDVPGSDLALSGLDFLYGVSTGNSKAPGRKVVVIGGGNVAIDVALTAKRLGAEHVAMVCLERLEEMPAWDYEIAQAKEEGVEILNSYGPKQILSQGTSVCGIELKKCPQVFDENGKFSPVYDENDTHTLDADCVILAIGQRTQPEFFQDATEHNGRTILVGKETGNTRGNIYAGGDVVQGPSTVVQAIADGRKAADAMYIKLGGMLRRDSVQSRMPINPDSFTQKQAEKIQMLPLEKRSVELEDALGLAVQEVYEEAKRCFHCGCVAVSPSDLAPALLVLDAEIETNTRVIPAGQFFAPVVGGSTVLEKGEFVLSIRLDKSHGGTYQRYVKHRVRKSLDFPVVSLACNMTIENGIVTDAKLAYGAVYAVPIRLYEVEELIKGKKLTPELTVKAADLAVKGAQPLEENSYKVNIARALVRRTLAGAMES